MALRFYFTAHPSDATRRRLPEGADVMLVAAAYYDERAKRLRVRRPPADHVGRVTIDSGGYRAARRWGRYPWSPVEYAEWIAEHFGGSLPAGVKAHYLESPDGETVASPEKVAVLREMYRENGGLSLGPYARFAWGFEPVSYAIEIIERPRS